jgi:histidinol-phosphate aminotransferase
VAFDDLIRPELGPLKPYKPGLRVSQVRERSGREQIAKLSSNESHLGPFPDAIAAMQAALPRLNRYSDGGSLALREKLSRRLDVPVDQLVVSNGSNELLRLLGQIVLRPGDEVAFCWPSFVVYPMVADMFSATQVRVDLAEDGSYDLEALADAITDKTRLVFACNPNNPTGGIYRREAWERFLDRVPERCLLVVDEAYFEYVGDPDYPDTLRYYDGERPLVVTRTFSKLYALAGARIGYGIMPPAFAEAIDKVREPFNVNTVAQVGAYFSLDDADEAGRRKQQNAELRGVLCSCFDGLGIEYLPSETNFVFIKTKAPVEVFQALLEEGIIVRDFGPLPGLRVGVGSPEETRRTCEAFESVVARLGSV